MKSYQSHTHRIQIVVRVGGRRTRDNGQRGTAHPFRLRPTLTTILMCVSYICIRSQYRRSYKQMYLRCTAARVCLGHEDITTWIGHELKIKSILIRVRGYKTLTLTCACHVAAGTRWVYRMALHLLDFKPVRLGFNYKIASLRRGDCIISRNRLIG